MPEFVGQIWNNEYFQLVAIVVLLVVLVMAIMAFTKANKAQNDAGVALNVVAKKEGLPNSRENTKYGYIGSSGGGYQQYSYTGLPPGEGFLGRMEAPVLYVPEDPTLYADYRSQGVTAEDIQVAKEAAEQARAMQKAATDRDVFNREGLIATGKQTDDGLAKAMYGL